MLESSKNINMKVRSANPVNWTTVQASDCIEAGRYDDVYRYDVDVVTDLGQKETLYINAINSVDAEKEARKIVALGVAEAKGSTCVSVKVKENTKEEDRASWRLDHEDIKD